MKKNISFCSICTVGYIAQAATLNDSLRMCGISDPHYVLIVDDPDRNYSDLIKNFNFIPIYLDEVSIPNIDNLISKYNPFELSNVLKPFFLEWLLNKNPDMDILLYLDSDIFVYDTFDEVIDFLNSDKNISVSVVPHYNTGECYDFYIKNKDYVLDRIYLSRGIYNGGFYALKNDDNARKFLSWHQNKLSEHGYDRVDIQMFVDQLILNMAPMLFNFFIPYYHSGYNVANWNYTKGLLKKTDGKIFSKNKPLVFFHYSQLPKTGHPSSNFHFDISDEDRILFQEMVDEYNIFLDKNNDKNIRLIKYGYSKRYKGSDLSQKNPWINRDFLRNIYRKLVPSRFKKDVKDLYKKFFV